MSEAPLSLEQLLADNAALRQQVAALQTAEAERRRVEETLKQREQYLRAFADALPDLAFILDEQGRYVEVLTGQKHLLYREMSQLQGRLLHEVLPQRDADVFLTTIRRTLATRTPQILEYTLDVPAGLRWFEARTSPMPHGPNRRGMVVWIARDITARKQAEAALQQAQETLEQRVQIRTASLQALNEQLRQEIVQRQELEASMRYRTRELETLVTIAMTLASSQPFQDKARALLLAMKTLGQGDMATLRMPQPEHQGLAVVVDSGPGELELEPVPSLPADQSISTLAYQRGEPIIVNEYTLHPLAVPSVIAQGVQAVIALPLKTAEGVLGIVSLTSGHKNHFTPERVRLLTAIASEIGLLVEKAQLIDELQTRTRNLHLANAKLQQEVAERLKAEKALQENVSQLRLLTDALPVLIAYIDADLRFRFNNKTYEAWYQLPRAAIYGKHVTDIADPVAYERLCGYIEQVLAGQSVTFDATLPYRDGQERYVHGTYIPDRDQTGAVKGFFALVSDLTEQQRTEQALQRAEHFALLGRLAAGVSHEIRNPLNAVFLYVDVLDEELHRPTPGSQAVIAESFTEIRTNLSRLEDLVQDYLSLLRVASMQREPEDLGGFVEALGRELQPQLTTSGITLHLEGLAGLGHVSLHKNSFRRVLLNLVHNALEAMPQGGTLTLRGWQTSSSVHLEVRDTGTGIPQDQMSLVFEPLHTTKPGGTGLGLYLVQEIIKAHDGHISVHSQRGQGTVFTITLARLNQAAVLPFNAPPGDTTPS